MLMIGVGLLGAAVAAIPGVLSALATFVAIQLYLLLDCVDGELARWRRTTSARGAFLDRIGHYVVEAALIAAVGVRADGGYDDIAGWTSVGLLAAVLHLLAKAETDLVIVARAKEGVLDRAEESVSAASDGGVLVRIRAAIAYVPFHRLLGAVELSLALVVVAAIEDLVADGLTAWFTLSLAVVAAVVAVGHALMIVVTGRLR